MNILYIDIDSLRPDHLGCYGYHRATSPNIDAIAEEGLRFTNCYTPDAPCLPSRTAMTTGRFGIHTGVVNHGGVASQPFNWGRDRGFHCGLTETNLARLLSHPKKYRTVAFSPFAQRHGAWHWYAGFQEMHNSGYHGMETANWISPDVVDWIERKGDDEKPFFMWVNIWDPHTPYRTPAEMENPFKDDPLPAWYNEDIRREHWGKPGPHSAQETNGFDLWDQATYDELGGWMEAIPRLQPNAIDSMDEARRMFDGYDMGVAYADLHIGKIIQALKDKGIYEDTAIIISSDHGENLGELWVYGDHQTADQCTSRLPMIVRWPGLTDNYAGQTDDRLIYNVDIAATILELCDRDVPTVWDGQSIAGDLQSGTLNHPHRDHLVLSQLAWCAQRAARWDHYLYIQTYHDGFHDYPDDMLFDLEADPHEQHNLADDHPELVIRGQAILNTWLTDCLKTATHGQDPLWTVMHEGGPLHVRDEGPTYLKRLMATGREESARRLGDKHSIDIQGS